MIPLAAVSIIAIGALLYLLHRAYDQIDELLNRIQAPEAAVVRSFADNGRPNPDPVPTDMGPWALPQPEEDDE